MWPFKKNKKEEIVIDSKYKINQAIEFFHNKDLRFGIVRGVRIDDNNITLYDIQIGGECPVIIKDVHEKDIIPYKK